MENTAVLFIHGFMGHTSEFKILKNMFSDLNYDVFDFILSGHEGGRIKEVTRNSWENDCIYNMEKLIKNDYKNIILVGHSMGGILASMMVNKYKKYVSKLILIAPAFGYLKMKDGKLNVFRSLKHSVNIFHDIKNRSHYSQIFRCSLSSIKEFRSLVREHKDDIYMVKCPVLFLNGDRDFVVPIEQTKDIYEGLENKCKAFFSVKGGSHWFLSSPLDSETYKEITSFLADNITRS